MFKVIARDEIKRDETYESIFSFNEKKMFEL